jgi:Fur family ferric uptake transcriptional regulator
MSSPDRVFEEFLEGRGLRFTSQRREILSRALAMRGHFEAEDLHHQLRKAKSGRISKASVYRTLPLLVEARLLREVEFVDRHMHYENVIGKEHHGHLICTSCRRVIEFRAPSIGKMLRSIARRHDFEEHSRKVEITGLCADCRRSSR